MSRFLPLLLLFLLFHSSSGKVEEARDGSKPAAYPFHKMNLRGLKAVEALQDYDYAGPNPKHDPRKPKPGGGRNP